MDPVEEPVLDAVHNLKHCFFFWCGHPQRVHTDTRMHVSEQPGRWVGILGVAPLLVHVSRRLDAHREHCLARVVGTLACVFAVYEAFWIALVPPRRVCLCDGATRTSVSPPSR